MSKCRRSARTKGPGARRKKAGKVVFLPQGIELELVGIIGPAGGFPGDESVESVFLDGDEDLRDLFESLRETAPDPAAWGGDDLAGGIVLNDGPLN